MLKLTQAEGKSSEIAISWHPKDDPRGHLWRAIAEGHLQDALRALADPMEFANVAADDKQAKEELRSVSWLMDLLHKRQDALIVALKDRRDADPAKQAGASWTDLVKLIDPDENEPLKKRSKIQQRYEASRRRVEELYEEGKRQTGRPSN
ncbi:hypothetical protein [Streptomyces mirabilis]|uniref:hypothetical protein n=1 Tax=Streptomyces mirabilis TaxID=68239 RepID=UPI0036A4C04D